MPTTRSAFNYTAPPEDLLSPIWTFRLTSALSLAGLALGELVFKTGSLHGVCLGFAAGQLIVLTVVCFQIKSVTLKQDPSRSDVQDLHIAS